MRVLITGATGFIGSHLTEALHAKGHQIRCLVRRTSNLVWIKHLPIDYIYGDLFDHDVLKKAVDTIDCIYHLAGITKAKTKAEYFLGNHIATKNLLQAILASNSRLTRFVHVSSQAAVGPSLNGKAVDEETPFHPITTYGVSKMEAEKECLVVRDRIPITITRPPAVYGPRDKDVFAFFNAMNGGFQPMIGFNNKLVSLIHVKDLIGGIVLAGEHPKATGQTYFISSNRYYGWREVGEVTARVMGKKRVVRLRIPEFGVYTIAAFSELFGLLSSKPVLLNFEKARDIVQDAWTCDISKATRELGFREAFTLEEGIRNTVEWYRQQGWLK
ncbi:MAG: NAD-dependent epimerase/dehydratase family protein [Ignavibacteria bacterium]|nr:NAD-dependent epimerase/dehydratase family protein [Ignavibacteria bacterium]